MMNLNMIAVVTGATGGYGRSLCGQAKSKGYFVIAISRTQKKLDELQMQGLCDLNYAVDYLDDNIESKLNHIRATILSKGISKIDLLINNAGIGSKGASLLTETASNIRNALTVNCIVPFLLTRICVESFSVSNVINISSRRGSLGQSADGNISKKGCSYSYRVSKSALNMLTLCIDEEFGENMGTYAIHPGKLTTGLGVSGASLSPESSAERLFNLLSTEPAKGVFYSIEEEEASVLPW